MRLPERLTCESCGLRQLAAPRCERCDLPLSFQGRPTGLAPPRLTFPLAAGAAAGALAFAVQPVFGSLLFGFATGAGGAAIARRLGSSTMDVVRHRLARRSAAIARPGAQGRVRFSGRVVGIEGTSPIATPWDGAPSVAWSRRRIREVPAPRQNRPDRIVVEERQSTRFAVVSAGTAALVDDDFLELRSPDGRLPEHGERGLSLALGMEVEVLGPVAPAPATEIRHLCAAGYRDTAEPIRFDGDAEQPVVLFVTRPADTWSTSRSA